MKIDNISLGLIVKRAFGMPLFLLYFLSWLSPRSEKIWIFGNKKGDNFNGNPKYLFLHITANKKDKVKGVWISKNKDTADKLKNQGYKSYHYQSPRGIYYTLRAKYFFIDESSDEINYWLSGGSKKIILWHGLPLKKTRSDTLKGKYGYFSKLKGIKKNIYNLLVPWANEKKEFIVTTSPLFKKIFSSAFRVEDNKIVITGYPRNDIFFREIKNFNSGDDKFLFQRIKNLHQKGKKIIFYLPTFRDTGGDVNLDIVQLKEFLRLNNAIFVTKFHRLAKVKEGPLQKVNSDKILTLPDKTDIYPILQWTDVLITDYSSICFDFLLSGKPIVFFPYDFEKYVTKDRELYFDYNEFTPGPKAYNFNELLSWIGYFLKGKDSYKIQREKIRNICFSYIDGESSERIFKTVNQLNFTQYEE